MAELRYPTNAAFTELCTMLPQGVFDGGVQPVAGAVIQPTLAHLRALAVLLKEANFNTTMQNRPTRGQLSHLSDLYHRAMVSYIIGMGGVLRV